VFHPDLSPGKKGSEEDIVGVIGIVGDFDEAGRWAERLPIPPCYVMETSQGRFQPAYFLNRPEPYSIAKTIAIRLTNLAQCDFGTKHLSHVWRIPGTPNWPNAKKVAAGRPRKPQQAHLVQRCTGEIAIGDLAAALPEQNSYPKPNGVHDRYDPVLDRPAEMASIGDLPKWCVEAIKTGKTKNSGGDRSDAVIAVACELARRGWCDDNICATLLDPDLAISEHVRAHSNPTMYARRQCARAREFVAGDRTAPPDGPPWTISPAAPYDTAKLFLRVLFTTPEGRSTLQRHRGGFYLWNGAAYPEADEADIRARVYEFLDQCVVMVLNRETKEWETVPVTPNRRSVNDLLDALCSVALLPHQITPPSWLEQVADCDPNDIIACANGLLHLPTLTLIPHTPVFFSHNALDYPFEPNAPVPVVGFSAPALAR
jgi:hypothetical protein